VARREQARFLVDQRLHEEGVDLVVERQVGVVLRLRHALGLLRRGQVAIGGVQGRQRRRFGGGGLGDGIGSGGLRSDRAGLCRKRRVQRSLESVDIGLSRGEVRLGGSGCGRRGGGRRGG